jgi:hypothetical protein
MQSNKTIYLFGMLLLFGVILNSCIQHIADLEQKYRLRVVEANGYLVPKDSIKPPKVIPRKHPRIVPAIANKMLAGQSDLHTLDTPRVTYAIMPAVFTPGQDTFLLPKVVLVIDLPIPTGLPTIVAAKEVKSLHPNPYILMLFISLLGYNGFVNGGMKIFALILTLKIKYC